MTTDEIMRLADKYADAWASILLKETRDDWRVRRAELQAAIESLQERLTAPSERVVC
jgi:hypothetical protein